MKRILAAIMVYVMAVSLCACGYNGTESKSGEASKSEGAKSVASETTQKADNNSVAKPDNHTTVSFTNEFGTATTKCAHEGCSNFIASSGDTNCCTTHSKRCLECKKYIDEDAMYCIDCIKKASTQSSGGNTTTSFTNDYGTASTKCAHAGCSNFIASSGDTNCCTTHSKRCLECKKYIDEDAMYCMSCIKKASTSGSGNSNNSSGGSNYSSGGSKYSSGSSGNKGAGGYDMPKENESFSDYVKRVDPDLYDSLFK